ncbi:rhodanese-like domain-containing protein [Rubritalea tangerina]|uniref:Rhodanese-like domain-containing protein n=1 Tax=Rubritalea tangerina TaxID=430798 RepID=A0ABW4Z8L4_9BACT
MKACIKLIALGMGGFILSQCAQPEEERVESVDPVVEEKKEKKNEEVISQYRALEIPIEKVFEMQQGGQAFLLDTRPPIFFNLGHIEGAHSLPLKTFDKSYQESKGVLDTAKSSGKVIVIYCQSEKCKDSFVMASKLHNRGYNVRVFKGGWELWKMSGLN